MKRKPYTSIHQTLTCAAALCALTLSAGSVQAQETWDDGGVDSNWTTDLNWADDTAPAGGERLTFTGTATATNNDLVAGTDFSLSLASGGWDLTGNQIDVLNSGSSDIHSNTTGSNTISFDVNQTAQTDWRVDTGGTLTMAGVISGGQTVSARGGGTLVLENAANDFGALLIGIDAGGSTVRVDSGAFGTGNIRIGWNANSGTLEYVGATGDTFAGSVQIGRHSTTNAAHTGGATITNNGSGDLIFSAATFNTISGTVTPTRNIEFNGTGSNIEVQGIINNAGTGVITLTKDGTNTLTLSGANTYTGDTTVSGGELVISGSNTAVNSYRSATTVASGATLSFSSTGNVINNQAGRSILLQNGSTLQNLSPNNFTVFNTGGGGTTVDTGASVTINHESNAGGTGFFLDDGLKGSGTVTINATNAGTGVNFRNNNSTFAGTMIVNGIASATEGAGSGIGVAGNTTGLQNADIELNGTMELQRTANDNLAISWANSGGAGNTFQMGALSGTGVMVGNHRSAGGTASVTLGNTNNDGTFSGVIADGTNNVTSITKAGTGTQTFSGANTYTGETTVSEGTLKVTKQTGLGTIAGTTTVANGATLELNHVPANNASPIEENITINGAGVGGTEGALKVTATGQGAEINSTITLGSNATFNNTVRVDHAGTVTDGANSFTLTKKGSGQHRAQFDADFAHLVIAEGEYEVASNLALPAETVTVNAGARLDIWRGLNLAQQTGHTPTITFDDGSKFNWRGNNVNDTASIGGAMVLNGTVDFEVGAGNGKQITVESDISGTGNLNFTRLASTSGTMILSGANSYSGNTTINSGVLEIGGTGTLGSGTYAGAIAFTGSATLDYNTSADQTLSGNITGAGKFQQNGSGTTTLSGANAYNGATNVNAGTLSLASGYTHSGTGAYTVQGGTLKIADGVDISTHAMTISLGGVISPGNSPGTAITGAQTWNDGGAYLWEINDSGGLKGDDPGWDWLSISGDLTLNSLNPGQFTIDITSLDLSNNAGLAAGFDYSGLAYGDPFAPTFIIATANNITGFEAGDFLLDGSGFVNGKLEWSISLDDGVTDSLVLSAVFVPEPSSTALLGLGGLMLALRRRRA